eukprot:CAMPEP_0194556830 /NCGR_PEP_ID=MMETSP0253-20130528/98942_1 /TAXON_ID=2966 /ORGANISM="Noctiluca scintillans" /LENGTH=111 /DNA_ID=CAMNT_0039404335 /DNA_START=325 /DNA_END=657 /DNA_ORIENTATION=+
MFQAIAIGMVVTHEDFVAFPSHFVRVTEWWKMTRNWESNVLNHVWNFQQFWSGVVFSFGYVFRLPWYMNVQLVVVFLATMLFVSFLLLSDANAVTRVFHLVYEPVVEYEPW